jgi:hypothetical protein
MKQMTDHIDGARLISAKLPANLHEIGALGG